eukprot:CAMPEP_0113904938 /NCGR_PEP_ID=MMETSP0780_2-20120614/23643_1 /TAXON_ID=652834 /ORGANISM="Palpitomonas bilix" /LENGTH=106 /DNA_ID=CAMNT_0000898829 /DNA_START=199 /DNA_END=519 /DNA_ORIENTATION=+ /assembly_acc=CAM_ASM_000599
MAIIGSFMTSCAGYHIGGIYYDYQCNYTEAAAGSSVLCCSKKCSTPYVQNTCTLGLPFSGLYIGAIVSAGLFVIYSAVFGCLYWKKRGCLVRRMIWREMYGMGWGF